MPDYCAVETSEDYKRNRAEQEERPLRGRSVYKYLQLPNGQGSGAHQETFLLNNPAFSLSSGVIFLREDLLYHVFICKYARSIVK